MRKHRVSVYVASCLVALAGQLLAANKDSPGAARHIDELIATEVQSKGGSPGELPDSLADDATYLRRVWLDLIGTPPSPEEVTAFVLDRSADKRAKMVDRLLADPRFGQNWARYWRDVILSRRVEERALIVSTSLTEFLSDSFNQQPYWDKIARSFITAKGNIREVGATAIIMAQDGNTEDTAAEVSRIFLGIQIQCAQCHHHKTDRWKREQFHQLAAFFPRIAVRPVQDVEPRTFEVVSVDRAPRVRPNNPNARRGSLEHRMPDLNHPEQEGKLMTPVFFATGQKLETGLSDADRRGKLADWMTSRNDRWFAKAFVNRMWSEFVGHGFYEPVDDIGPDRTCLAPKTLEYLADEFAGHRFDVKWLLRTICATQSYQRPSRSRQAVATAPYAAACPQRLRGDQLFDSLVEVLGIPEGPQPPRDNPRALQQTPRGRLNATFGYDPSVLREEVAGSIPQALFLMNAPELNRAINGRQQRTSLGRLLAEEPNNEMVIEELYLRTLAREPKPDELATCLAHVRGTRNRAEAFEDIVWSLINSTEFLNRK